MAGPSFSLSGGEMRYRFFLFILLSVIGIHLLEPGQGGHVFPREISIDRSYPSGWATEPDPRSDSRIYYSLKEADVLVL
jgi:hypothetical protein